LAIDRYRREATYPAFFSALGEFRIVHVKSVNLIVGAGDDGMFRCLLPMRRIVRSDGSRHRVHREVQRH